MTSSVQAQPLPSAAAEAARYALLRRLAPSMRHHLVVYLQPIGMVYEVMDRRLRAPQPDLVTVHESAQKINGFARAALDSCLDVVTWFAPDEGKAVAPADCAEQCVGLLATSLSFRGFSLRNEVPDLPRPVSRAAIRHLMAAAMLYLTDEQTGPAELVLGAQALEEGVRLQLDLVPSDGHSGFPQEPAYRPISWLDLQALADADGAMLAREVAERSGLRIVIPWASAPA